MILSVSRRTDIPSYYSEWFYNRIKEGYVCVRNPMNLYQISKIKISPDVVDCIVFWTKNPKPMLEKLDFLNDYNYYFQFTLNSYGKDVEENIPLKGSEVIDTFQRLSARIGKEKVIWRYDPILINAKYTEGYHAEYFSKVAEKLHDYTEKCTISFIDLYRNTKNNVKNLNVELLTDDKKKNLAKSFKNIAQEYNLTLETCAEEIDLSDLGIEHSRCIDNKLIERITGCKVHVDKDKNQRVECGCIASIDIGMYNTCLNGCKYCYANLNMGLVRKNVALHDKSSPLICGNLTNQDKITNRDVKSYKDEQIGLF